MSEFARELTELIEGLAAGADEPNEGQISPLWTQVCELGLTGVGISEDAGGSGGGIDDFMVVVRELARAGIGTPIVEASIAAYATSTAPRDGFDTIVIGDEVRTEDGAITTRFPHVPYVEMANRLVIVTASSTLVVLLSQPSVHISQASDIAGQPCGSVDLDGAFCVAVSDGPAVVEITDRLALARSSALLGSAWGAYEITRRYVAEREQFGAPLIKIPAVSTTLAKMAVGIRSAQHAVDRATSLCADAESVELRRSSAISAARIATADTATLVARCAHQLNGAVGVTQEYDLHRYTTRLWAWRDADTPQRTHCARLGARVRAEGETVLWDVISA
jgi:acyl-CoA dehydrogenase